MDIGVRQKPERQNTRGPHPVDIHVGHRLRQLRTLAGISQTVLGEKIGITFQQIQKYESGANRISASRLWIMAVAFDVPVSSFFEGLDGTPSGKSIASRRRTLEIVRSLERCPPALQNKLHKAINAIADELSDRDNAPIQ